MVMYDPKEVLKVCEKATPGPWEVNTDHRFIDIINPRNPKIRIATAVTENDADCITLARTALPEFAQRVIELEAYIKAIEKNNSYLVDMVQQSEKENTNLRAMAEAARISLKGCLPDEEGFVVCDGHPYACDGCDTYPLKQAFIAAGYGGEE